MLNYYLQTMCASKFDNMCETKITKPCGGCPFGRVNDNEKPNPGGSKPEVYLGQVRGPFWLPCHNDKNYAGKESHPSIVKQCAGVAIFRSNIEMPYKLPDNLLQLPPDHDRVFSTPAEFYSFYTGCSIEEAETLLTREYLDKLTTIEFVEATTGMRPKL